MTCDNSHFISSLYIYLGLTIMFPVTFRILFYTSKMPKYVKNLNDRSIYTKLWKVAEKYLMNPTMSISLLEKLDKSVYITRKARPQLEL